MTRKLKVHYVDDDVNLIDLVGRLVSAAGHQFTSSSDSNTAYGEIEAVMPDCLLLDIMMPGTSGLELCKRVREDDRFTATKIIMVSAKAYDFDYKCALGLGADGYITKPVDSDSFVSQVEAVVSDRLEITFWGVRGTLPVPGPRSLHYGGNTSCVSVGLPKDRLFIFDAGTGIKPLSDHLMAHSTHRLDSRIFISHPHWDHINALPYFGPLYRQGNRFEICGARHGDKRMRELISAQMDGVYFPVTTDEFVASIEFHDLDEGVHSVDGIDVQVMRLNHPGHCLGYRVNYRGRAVCYVTDNELFPETSRFHNPRYIEQLTEFVAFSDALITDCTYTDEEYRAKEGWGHSSVAEVVRLAHDANVRNLFLFHHDPEQSDVDIRRKLEVAELLLAERCSSTRCIAPAEGSTFEF